MAMRVTVVLAEWERRWSIRLLTVLLVISVAKSVSISIVLFVYTSPFWHVEHSKCCFLLLASSFLLLPSCFLLPHLSI